MDNETKHEGPKPALGEGLVDLNLKVTPDLYRAFHRCCWILINESEQDQLAIMDEMVRDFLIKHGC